MSACILSGCPSDGATSVDAATGSAVGQAPEGGPATGSPPGDAGTDGAVATPDPASLDTDYKAFHAALDKLRSCGLVDDGIYPFDPLSDARCVSLCMLSASCADLKLEACKQYTAPSLEACYGGCAGQGVPCGDGATVSTDVVCDLNFDCRTGEDEKHCETFTCKSDGTHVGARVLCDGVDDCSDGSDEVGCALVCGMPRVIYIE